MRQLAPLLVAVILAASASDTSAQPAPAPPTVDSRYRVELRNRPPFTPAAGAVELELPTRDADPRSVHALVQLDLTEVERARAQPELPEALRALFTAEPNASTTVVRLQRNLRGPTYEAVIRRDVADRLVATRSLSSFEAETARFIRWVGPIHPDVKLESALKDRVYVPWGIGPNGTFRLLVTFHEDAVGRAEEVLRPLAVEYRPYTNDTWSVLLDRDNLDSLVAEDGVRALAQGPKPFVDENDQARQDAGVNPSVQDIDTTSDPPTYTGLTGDGIAVAVMDTGVDLNHDDFWDHDAAGHRTVSRIAHQMSTPPYSLHGTFVAGVIGGSGYQSNRDNSSLVNNGGAAYQWRGMAPRVSILAFDNVSSGGDTAIQYDATVVAGADVSNDSHEQEQCLKYDEIAATVDALVQGSLTWMGTPIPARAAVWSAGNNGMGPRGCLNFGYFGLTVGSKNPIVVGSIDTRTGLLYESSSLGPTYDGRLKPDLVAPGCTTMVEPLGLTSTTMLDPVYDSLVSNGYGRMCGTSVAAPVVTGIVALLLQQWREEFGTTAACQVMSGGECFPFPSTLKAILIQGATDLATVAGFESPDTGAPVTYHNGPDYASGYGLVNAEASIAIVAAGAGIGRRVVESEVSAAGPPDEYLIQVPAGAQRLRVTLAWDDEPGNDWLPDTTPHLINDIDLELISEADVTVLPWVLPAIPLIGTPKVNAAGDYIADRTTDPIQPAQIQPAQEGVDTLNNVEQVEVVSPAAGTWRVRVKGASLDIGKSQPYSLASDYALETPFVIPDDGPVAIPRAPRNLCVQMNWSRAGRGFQFEFSRDQRCGFVPAEPICRYVVDCRFCARFALCPEIRFTLGQVPEYFNVSIRRRDGMSVAVDESGERTKTLTWQLTPGEKYGLFFDAVGDARPAGVYAVTVEAEELGRTFVSDQR